MTKCRHCGAAIVHEPNVGWVDATSGDDGGTYDHCPEGWQWGHEPETESEGGPT